MKIELDEGYAFGLGIFETIKVKEGRAFALEKHMKRLQRGLAFFEFSQKITAKDIEEYIAQQIEKDFSLKVMVSEKNILFVKRENSYHDRDKQQGLKLRTSSVKRNSTSPLVYYKSLQCADNILEKRKAKQQGYDEVLFLNEKDFICEGAVSNIFFLRDKELYTPKIEDGLLPGTMREQILENYTVKEVSISREELACFDACFVSNALMGILWVESIDKIYYQKTSIIKKMMEDFKIVGY